MNERQIELSFLLGLLWLIVLSYLCLAPVSGPSMTFPYVDKLAHAGFFLLGGLCLGALPISRAAVVIGLCLLFALGGFLEVLQSLTGFRHAEWGDLLADALGAAFGVLIMLKMPLVRQPQTV